MLPGSEIGQHYKKEKTQEGFPSWLEISDHVFTVKQSEGENRERGDPGTGEAIEFSLSSSLFFQGPEVFKSRQN